MRGSLLLSGSLLAIAAQLVGAAGVLKPRRASILIDPAAQPDLPSLASAKAAAAAADVNLDNIQGDILIGMKKNKELFFFFAINDAATFKAKLKSDIHGLITTTTQLLPNSTQSPTTAVNIAFSQVGLNTLGVTDNLGDALFFAGQAVDATALGDPGTVNWVPQFANKSIHGVFLLASNTVDNVNSQLANIQTILGASISEVYSLEGAARPNDQAGHEHFGFMDGISQPAVTGFNAPGNPGQAVVPAGIILVGGANDPGLNSRPASGWATDGSFLAFRQLEQKVPEFNKFLTDNPIPLPGLTPEQGSELMGARMVGRWKSGAPIDLAPFADDPALAADPNRNNNFDFSHPGEDLTSNQTRCPFSAHIRKTAPRADFIALAGGLNVNNHILRAGIPYGPEVTPDEAASNTSSIGRGLAFVSYQSVINNGFHFIQQSWANNKNFVLLKSDSTPGFDPIIGVAPSGQARFASGLDTTDPNHDYTIPDFIVSRGGEYFFSPSLSAIAGILSD